MNSSQLCVATEPASGRNLWHATCQAGDWHPIPHVQSHRYASLHRFSLMVLLCFIPLIASAQSIVKYQINDLLLSHPTANWMFDYDNYMMWTDDANPYTYSAQAGYSDHRFAFQTLAMDAVTNTDCIAQSVSHSMHNADDSLQIGELHLVGFDKVNTLNPAAAWDTPGQSGMRLTYQADSMIIYYLGIPKLVFSKVVLVFTIPYPDQQDINALGGDFAHWRGSLGTGGAPRGLGYAQVDTVLSDPAWIDTWSPEWHTNCFYLTDLSYTDAQDNARLSFKLDIAVPDHEATTELTQITPANTALNFAPAQVAIEFSSYMAGGVNADQDALLLTFSQYPLTLPCSKYGTSDVLEFFTTLDDFTASLTFTVEQFYYQPEIYSYQIRYSPAEHEPSTVWTDYDILDSNHVRLNNVNVQGYFYFPVQPVELGPWNLVYQDADCHVNINWVTESETNLEGYNIYRAETSNISEAVPVNPVLISATNSSEQHTYTVHDEDVTAGHTYYYWMEVIDLDGYNSIHGPASVTITGTVTPPPSTAVTTLGWAFPNPLYKGNKTNISASIKAGESGVLSIYNSKGQSVETYRLNAGNHTIQWDGSSWGDGVYFYRLQTPSVKLTRKLILLK